MIQMKICATEFDRRKWRCSLWDPIMDSMSSFSLILKNIRTSTSKNEETF